MTTDEPELEGLGATIDSGLRKTLDRHGYGFQYAVLKRGEVLLASRASRWLFQAAEFPVSVQDSSTKIDFVLEHSDRPLYLIAECKRANPAFLNWCFVRAPYTRRDGSDSVLLGEHVIRESTQNVYAGKSELGHTRALFGLGFELKTGEPGDPGGPGKGSIEEAAGQVSRGVSGFIDFLSRHPPFLPERKKVLLLPVIFTTARVWISDVDISEADLTTGRISAATLEPKQVPWAWLRYHISPTLRQMTKPAGSVRGIGDALDFEYTRSIAIVSGVGVDAFLSQDWREGATL